MKKLFFLFITLNLLLTGCQKKTSNEDALKVLYEGYYESISANTSYVESSEYYDLSFELAKSSNGTYQYKITLDNPQIAMYNIVMMVVEDNISYAESTKMMPSVGIFDDKYSLIPNQVNRNRNFMKGVILSGQSDSNTIEIKLLVEWNNKSQEKTNREFFDVVLTEGSFSLNNEE